MQYSETSRWDFVVDEVSGKTGRLVGEVVSKGDRTYRLLLAQLADGSKVTFFPTRIRAAKEEEIQRYVRETKPQGSDLK
jgi:hypothetical protein